MAAPGYSERAAHPIQVAARRTGLSTYVLRAWEQRYNAVSPERSATGRRLYSDADIERLKLLQFATSYGRRIGEVAGLPWEELAALCATDRHSISVPAHAPATDLDRTSASVYRRACLEAIRCMDSGGLESALYSASVAVSASVLLDHVIAPLLHEIGDQYCGGTLRIGQEHIATASIRSFLGTLKINANVQHQGPRIVVGAPSGEKHELGALMAAVMAASEGWDSIYLGTDTPTAEIAGVALRTGAAAVALSIVYSLEDDLLDSELLRLRQQLGPEPAILVGGAAAACCRARLEDIGASILEDFTAMRATLDSVNRASQAPPGYASARSADDVE
jgi:methylmalonyl-CoA mutase cobalamin-binding subunit